MGSIIGYVVLSIVDPCNTSSCQNGAKSIELIEIEYLNRIGCQINYLFHFNVCLFSLRANIMKQKKINENHDRPI